MTLITNLEKSECTFTEPSHESTAMDACKRIHRLQTGRGQTFIIPSASSFFMLQRGGNGTE
jgi:hypothetical protein